jgi:hypothetical protein
MSAAVNAITGTNITAFLDGLKTSKARRNAIYWTAAVSDPALEWWTSVCNLSAAQILKLATFDPPATARRGGATFDEMVAVLGHKGKVAATIPKAVKPDPAPPPPPLAAPPLPAQVPQVVAAEYARRDALPFEIGGNVLCTSGTLAVIEFQRMPPAGLTRGRPVILVVPSKEG